MSERSKQQQAVKVVKKVRAFPIPVQLKTAAGALSAQLVSLNYTGFQAEVSSSSIKPGDRFECSFEMPVFHHFIVEPVVVVKLYNQWSGGNLKVVPQPGAAAPAAPPSRNLVHLIECHFQALTQENRAHITSFLTALAKQKS